MKATPRPSVPATIAFIGCALAACTSTPARPTGGAGSGGGAGAAGTGGAGSSAGAGGTVGNAGSTGGGLGAAGSADAGAGTTGAAGSVGDADASTAGDAPGPHKQFSCPAGALGTQSTGASTSVCVGFQLAYDWNEGPTWIASQNAFFFSNFVV